MAARHDQDLTKTKCAEQPLVNGIEHRLKAVKVLESTFSILLLLEEYPRLCPFARGESLPCGVELVYLLRFSDLE